MSESRFQNSPPASDTITDYDHVHLSTYLRLLDADKEGADWKEIVSVIFDTDPDRDPETAKQMYESHLSRAKWISEQGFHELVKKK